MKKTPVRKLQSRARELGAAHVKLIDPATVAIAAWVRLKCQYGCDGYGLRLTCPPYSPTPEQTRKVLDCYAKALLVHGSDYSDVNEIVRTLEREAFLGGYYKAYAMGAGPCTLCRSCNVGGTCRKGLLARPSMEASGIDVYRTVRDNGFSIEVVRSHRQCPNYFGLLLIE